MLKILTNKLFVCYRNKCHFLVNKKQSIEKLYCIPSSEGNPNSPKGFEKLFTVIRATFNSILFESKLMPILRLFHNKGFDVKVLQFQMQKKFGLNCVSLGSDVKFAELIKNCLRKVQAEVNLKGLNIIVDNTNMPNDTFATYSNFSNMIKLNPLLLNKNEEENTFIVLHELGHKYNAERVSFLNNFIYSANSKGILPFDIPEKLLEQFYFINGNPEDILGYQLYRFYNQLKWHKLSSEMQEYNKNERISEFIADFFALKHMEKKFLDFDLVNNKEFDSLYRIFIDRDEFQMKKSFVKYCAQKTSYDEVRILQGWSESYEQFVVRAAREISVKKVDASACPQKTFI